VPIFVISELPANRTNKWLNYASIALVLTGVGALVLFFMRRRFRPVRQLTREATLSQPITRLTATGLTEAEAAARLDPGQDNLIQGLSQRTRRQMIREGTLTIFNLNLVGLALVQAAASRWLDALITIGVLFLNVGLNVFQEEFARYRIQALQRLIHPRATVIRESKPRTIEADQIVVGDVISAGPGDQIMVDGVLDQGELVVDESLLSGDSTSLHKFPGDLLYAGSVCLSGRATYQAEKVGDQRLVVSRLQETCDSREVLTPIEQIMKRVMRVLLVLIILLATGVIIRYLRLDTTVMVEEYIDAVNVIFNLAPAGLFFMVILTYAAATADLAQTGALVHRARSVESLAHLNVMCFAKAGFLTGTTVEIRPSAARDGESLPDEVALRKVLGDFVRSTSATNLVTQAITSTFEGTRRDLQMEAASLSIDGWNALVFDDEDLPGVYVLGDPQVMWPGQVPKDQEQAGEAEQASFSPAALGKQASSLVRPFSRLLKRGRGEKPADQQEENTLSPVLETTLSEETAAEEPEAEEAPSGGFLGRFRRRTMELLSRTQIDLESTRSKRDPDADETILTLAHTTIINTLYDDDGAPQLPEGLTPLCDLSYQEKVRPEALAAIQTFSSRGVEIKIFTPDSADKTLELLSQVNSDEEAEESRRLQIISGSELASLEPEQMTQTATDHTVFSQVSQEQTEQIVEALRQSGKAVGVLGNGVSDVAAMRQADLALSRRSSSPAALSAADIILLDDSPLVLSRVVDKGQRIVNGLLDVLKLYLTQVFYMLLLIVGIPLVVYGFPYSSAQGGLIALITLTIPAVGLSLWATGGQLHKANLGRELSRFIWPAALTMGLVGLVVYALFLQRSNSTEYAQLAVTYALVAMGLMLVIFIKPPLHFARGRLPARGDLRPTLLVMAAALIFVVMTYIPLAQRLFEIAPLRLPEHYLVIGLATAAWALGLRFLWLVIPLERRVRSGILSKLPQNVERTEEFARRPALDNLTRLDDNTKGS